ncbi:MAG TPA: hypothetical protein VFO73_00675 [Candidatus Limnocylindrales bacterium]|nr:hypothetical protein [Candidatus Limnocylindrales bacterium]
MHGRRRGARLPLLPALATALLAALIAAACGTTQGPTPEPTGSVAPSGPSGSPGASGEVGPRGTPWPGNAVLGIEALGAADGQILAAINDFNTAVATEDLPLMRRAADGLAGLDVLLPNLDKITIYEPMRPFADRYGAAIRAIAEPAKALRTAIDGGDAAGITRSGQDLVAGFQLYTGVQPELAAWVEQSIEQRRLLVR